MWPFVKRAIIHLGNLGNHTLSCIVNYLLANAWLVLHSSLLGAPMFLAQGQGDFIKLLPYKEHCKNDIWPKVHWRDLNSSPKETQLKKDCVSFGYFFHYRYILIFQTRLHEN